MIFNFGGFKFDITMINGVNIESDFGINKNDRLLNYPAYFRANFGDVTINLECKTLPFKKHGNKALKPLYDLANSAKNHALVSGAGEFLGFFVITNISENRSVFDNSGRFFVQNFNLTLKGVK